MSIVIDIDKVRLLENARHRTNLCFLLFSPTELVSTIQADIFPDVEQKVRHCFVDRGPLACIAPANDGYAIYIHQLLNHPDTPPELMSMIAKHELQHLRIPAVQQDGEWESHPPEFWQAEAVLCPERTACWAWIWMNLYACLRRNRREQQIDVKRQWKRVWNQPKIDILACAEFAGVQGCKLPKYGAW